MTREEAKKVFEYLEKKANTQEPCDDTVSIRKDVLKCRVGNIVAYNVEWLKKHWQMEMEIVCGVKPNDDAISREDAFEIIASNDTTDGTEPIFTGRQVVALLSTLPSVTQKPIECDDAISRDVVLGLAYDMSEIDGEHFTEPCMVVDVEDIQKLPPVTQKSGKWIKIKSGDKDFPESIVCSRCNNENSHLDFNENAEPIGKVFVTSKYCPNCGARMESEVNNG